MLQLIVFSLCLGFSISAAARCSSVFTERVITSSLLLTSAIVLSGSILGNCDALRAMPWCLLCLGFTALLYLTIHFSIKKPPPREPLPYPGHCALAFILCSVTLAVLAAAMVFIFEPANIDDLDYHYAKVLLWLRAAGFSRTGIDLVDAYPQNGELLAAFAAVVSGTTSLADSFQFLTLPLLWASTFRLIRGFGVTTAHAVIGTVLATIFPAITSLVATLHVDVFALACLLSATSLLFAVGKLPPRMRLALIGASLGLLMGTKYVALPWVAILCVATLASPTSRPRRLSEFLLLGVPLFLLGSERYLSNALTEANPLYPYTIPFLNLFTQSNPRLLSGLWEERMSEGDTASYRILMSWFSPEGVSRTNYEHWYGGFGLVWPLLLACSLVALVSAIRAKDRAFILLFLLGTALFLATPAHHTVRFVLFLPAFGAVGFGRILDRVRSELIRTIVVGISLVVALHCVRQHISLLSRELSDRRGTDLVTSCANTSRPSAFRSVTRRPISDSLTTSTSINVVLGSAIQDRLLSYGCLWVLAPKATITVHELEALPEVLLSTKEAGSDTLVIISSLDPAPRTLDPDTWTPLFQESSVTVFKLKEAVQ
jgi:hypothetical protein